MLQNEYHDHLIAIYEYGARSFLEVKQFHPEYLLIQGCDGAKSIKIFRESMKISQLINKRSKLIMLKPHQTNKFHNHFIKNTCQITATEVNISLNKCK